ncbi:hypothetical protein OB905_03700 [Halobacteria archaeon AArc-dxtr1]|nr:hypothetical protein [Halobacteria archaeon AArc-dxtr1]
MTDRDDELEVAIQELAGAVEELRVTLESQRRSPVRAPMPSDLFRVADELAIPAALAVLKANVRALEAFQRGLKLVRTEREARDRSQAVATETSRRAEELRQTTVSQLDRALSELQRAVSAGSLPADDRAHDLLAEAQQLRDDVDRRLQKAGDDADSKFADVAEDDSQTESRDSYTIEIDDGSSEANDSHVDVDAELETLKDRYGTDDPEREDGDDDDNSASHDPEDQPDTTAGAASGGKEDDRDESDDSDGGQTGSNR